MLVRQSEIWISRHCGRGGPHIVPQGSHLTVVLQQHAALKVQKQAAVIHVDAAHHGCPVVAHPALGMQEAGVYS